MSLHNPTRKITSANSALKLLKEGNRRFTTGKLSAKNDYAKIRGQLTGGQKPFAIILCCADSRVAPEVYFDMKLGDIFVIRNAGNVVDDVVLGSIEYGAEHLGSPLVVVLGHTSCGAVTAACEGGKLPKNIESIVKKIQPSVKKDTPINEVARRNAVAMAAQIKKDPIIKHLGTTVVAAVYDIETGKVKWES